MDGWMRDGEARRGAAWLVRAEADGQIVGERACKNESPSWSG